MKRPLDRKSLTRRTTRPLSIAHEAFAVVVALCIAAVGIHVFLTDAVIVRICEEFDKDIPREKRLPVFLSEIAFDGYLWNRHAEHLGGRNGWRLRHTDFDNAPFGREVHWNSAFAWYLRGLGELRRAFTGEPLRNAIFRMSIWANSILLILALAIIPIRVLQRFGPLSGAVVAVGMIAVTNFYEGFQPAYPDHHGIISLTHLGMLLGVVWAGAGWVRKDEAEGFVPARSHAEAQRGMICSALCGAAGLWFSALSTAIVIAVVGVGAVISAALFARSRSDDGSSAYVPGLWKTWALWGAGGSLAFYLLEYFPHHMGLQLEVNHPLYALAWLGGGWNLALLTGWLAAKDRRIPTLPWRRMILPTLAMATLPVFIAFGGATVFAPNDPFLKRLFRFISELQPLLQRFSRGQINLALTLGWHPILVAGAGLLLFSRRVERGTKAALAFLTIPILLLLALQFYQTRWALLAGPFYIVLAAIFIPQLWRLIPARFSDRALILLLALPFGYYLVLSPLQLLLTPVWRQYFSREQIPISPRQAMIVLHRQMAYALREDAGDRPVVLLSSPNSSVFLAGLGGFQTVGTLYWENVAGLKAAASMLNAQTDEEAFALLEQRGVTHIALITWENFIEPYFQILHPQPSPGVSFSKSFGRRIFYDRQLSASLRPIVFPLNEFARSLKQQILLLRVAPEQSDTEASYHAARYVRIVDGAPHLARALLEQAPAASPTDPFAPLLRLELATARVLENGTETEVEELLQAIADVEPAKWEEPVAAAIQRLFQTGRRASLAKLLHGVAAQAEVRPLVLFQAAWGMATIPEARDPARALACCERLDSLGHDRLATQLVRAAALAAQGRFDAAMELATDVHNSRSANPNIKKQAEAMRAVFATGKPWTEPVPPAAKAGPAPSN